MYAFKKLFSRSVLETIVLLGFYWWENSIIGQNLPAFNLTKRYYNAYHFELLAEAVVISKEGKLDFSLDLN